MRDFTMHRYSLGYLVKIRNPVWEAVFLLQLNDSYRFIRVEKETERDFYTSFGMSGRIAWI